MTPPKKPPPLKPRASGVEKRAVQFTDRDRAIVAVVIEEVMNHIGVTSADRHRRDHEEHTEDHAQWQVIQPWIESKKISEQKRAEFWSKLVEKNAGSIFSGIFWFVMLSIALGVTGAWRSLLNWLASGPK